MTSGVRFGSRRISAPTALLALVGLALAVALLTPEAGGGGGGYSSYAAGPSGTRILYELAQRMGWRASRREAPLDSGGPQRVHVVIASGALGARETHRLLENVRRGGGLIFSVGEAPDLADSLGMRTREGSRTLISQDAGDCPPLSTFGERRVVSIPPTGHEIAWRRPAPGPVTGLATGFAVRQTGRDDIVVGFTLGAGRIVAYSSSDLVTNESMRVCPWGADLVAARALDYVRPVAVRNPRIEFDEYHHGYGRHGGSVTAVSMFLSRTSPGRFLAQALVAALVLLFAAAPRPIVPTDPARIMRRSPLEHADALAHAYADVGATRTATSRLVEGLRRRAGRTVSVARNTDDAGFLAAVERRNPSLAPHVATVRRGITEPLRVRDFTTIGNAVSTIERELLTSPPAHP